MIPHTNTSILHRYRLCYGAQCSHCNSVVKTGGEPGAYYDVIYSAYEPISIKLSVTLTTVVAAVRTMCPSDTLLRSERLIPVTYAFVGKRHACKATKSRPGGGGSGGNNVHAVVLRHFGRSSARCGLCRNRDEDRTSKIACCGYSEHTDRCACQARSNDACADKSRR